MTELEQRATVITEAMTWLNTPYHKQADLKGCGVDCSMLLVRVYVDTGVLAPFDPRPYSPDWHLHNAEENYVAWLDKLGQETKAPQPGDMAVFRFGHCFSHAGILISDDTVVHAYARDNRVVMGTLDQPPFLHPDGTQRLRKFYTLW